jgi:hypothetical protein
MNGYYVKEAVMNGHPAIAYLIAEHLLEERRHEARSQNLARSASRTRSVRLGKYRLTITREGAGVSRTL